MVFIKVRETYDLHTVKNKMTVIGIHTPKPDIIKRNYPGLLMQCRAYRPVSADVRVACASVQPLDPLGVGTTEGAVAPEDVFNPILYKAMSNKGMSQLEARINGGAQIFSVQGDSANVNIQNVTDMADEFGVYYGLLANTHDWKHANPQAGLEMRGLRPLVYEMVYNVGDMHMAHPDGTFTNDAPATFSGPGADGNVTSGYPAMILGKAKEFPFIPCTNYTLKSTDVAGTSAKAGFPDSAMPGNCSVEVPYLPVICGCIIVPPSKMHELFYRMVVEWTIEFTQIRPISEITDWIGLRFVGDAQHYQNYSYSATKKAITGTDETILKGDSCMVSANVDVNKVM